jgi:hypothetical protein
MKQFVILMLLLPLASFGQRPNQLNGRAMERLESYKKVRMLEVLKLDDEKGSKLVTRYTNHRATVRAVEEERMKVIDKLEKQAAASASDAEYQRTFTELTDIEKRMTDVRAKYLQDLKEIMTPRQIAEYLIFERNFARDIRDVMRENQKDRKKRER